MNPRANFRSGWSLEKRDPKFIQSLMPFLQWLYRYYFRVQTDGWHHTSKGKTLASGFSQWGHSLPRYGNDDVRLV